MAKKRIKKPKPKLSRGMRKKLFVLFSVLVILLCALIGRLMYINYTSGEKYEKKVLSLQSYDSVRIPYQRGDIVDRNGTVMATSIAVYDIILDCKVITSTITVGEEKVQRYLEPTLNLLFESFPQLDEAEIREFIRNNPEDPYEVILEDCSYNDIQPYIQVRDEVNEDNIKVNTDIKGVWFEKRYVRKYPFDSLACSTLGFTSSGNVGLAGLEQYYNDTLNGIDGREYGYLNSESDFEKTVIAPQDGHTLVSTIDANIQSIVEKKIAEFNAAYTNNERDGDGSINTAVIVMNPNTGAVLAMADYPTFDLNHAWDTSGLFTEEELANITEEEKTEALQKIWNNFCVSSTYEPGSVQKPFTVACGLETGTLNSEMTFVCDGHERVSGHFVGCVNLNGHGVETLEKSLMDSCNDALMQMSYLIGVDDFAEYQSIYGFGQRTGVDLPGEASTASLIYTAEDMTAIDLATNVFGQNYNATMIQIASAYSSLVNGGTYYRPYLVSKIVDANGGTVSITEPTVLKQTISEATSDVLRSYMYSTVTSGTGSTAKVDGYSMGGKTGTAEKQPRNQGNYLVSFIGFAPYENPELVIYCIVDEPNTADQPHSYYAQNIVREILEEVLPYLNIYPDEELTGANADLDITGTDPYFKGERDGQYLPTDGTSAQDVPVGAGENAPTGGTAEPGTPEDSGAGAGENVPTGGTAEPGTPEDSGTGTGENAPTGGTAEPNTPEDDGEDSNQGDGSE